MTLPEPRLDESWSARGEELEDLSRVAGAQPWTAGGATTTRSELTMRRRRRSPEVLQRLDAVRDQALHQVRVEATTGLGALTLEAWCAGRVTALVCTDSPTSLAGRRLAGTEVADLAEQLHVEEIPTGWLPVELAGWLGIGPAWSGDLEAAALPMSTITARVDDPAVPVPDGAGELLRAAWAQPWHLWTVQTGTRGAIGIGAGTSGHLQLTRDPQDPEAVHLQSWPAAHLWSTLRSLCLDWEDPS